MDVLSAIAHGVSSMSCSSSCLYSGDCGLAGLLLLVRQVLEYSIIYDLLFDAV
jgi:hypothetical protein